MRARRTVAVIGAITAVAALAGCAGEPGTVAEVDGRTITQDDLARVTEELSPFLADASDAAVLSALVQSTAGIELGERKGLEVTAKRAATFLDSIATNSGLEPSDWGEGSIMVAQMQLLGEEFSQLPDPEAATAEFQQILADLDITVNPRYGEYDPATGEVSALAPEWIVTPAAGADGAAEDTAPVAQ